MTLKGYYFKTLKETDPQKEFRERVMKRAGISRSMFYNYVNERWPVPKDIQIVFAEEANMEPSLLFSFTYSEKCKA